MKQILKDIQARRWSIVNQRTMKQILKDIQARDRRAGKLLRAAGCVCKPLDLSFDILDNALCLSCNRIVDEKDVRKQNTETDS